MRLRHARTYPRAPLVMVALLRLTTRAELFASVAVVARQLHRCIDDNHMHRSVLYMRAVLQAGLGGRGSSHR